MSMRRSTKIAIVFTGSVIACLALLAATPARIHAYQPDYRELQLFRKVVERIQKDYVREVDDKELIQGAINGMLQSLDPYSCYLPAELFKELQNEPKDDFGDVGMDLSLENGILTVVSPIEDTPAYLAGLMPGDKIAKIDGEQTKNITVAQASKQMRGPKGTKVTLSIVRPGKKPEDVTLTREPIHVQSVRTQILGDGYAYIRVVDFQPDTAKHLADAVKKLASGGNVKGVVLDLRNNPGEVLEQAVKVSNLFLDKGLVVYTDGRNSALQKVFHASPAGFHYKFRLAVLINEGTAGASEVVAGCLQDHRRALLLGSKSYGKGSEQMTIPLENGGALRLTTAYYYTPRGRHIQKMGILPDLDLKKELDKQKEADAAKEKKEKTKKLQPARIDPTTDLTVSKALAWLKSKQSVDEFRNEHESATAQDTAWYLKKDEDQKLPRVPVPE
ncbi:MAG: S41 family peptidase [Thermodesulfobacteriota bacterium]